MNPLAGSGACDELHLEDVCLTSRSPGPSARAAISGERASWQRGVDSSEDTVLMPLCVRAARTGVLQGASPQAASREVSPRTHVRCGLHHFDDSGNDTSPKLADNLAGA
jgi:hypothetical protein